MALANQILERIFHSSSQTPWRYKRSGDYLDTSQSRNQNRPWPEYTPHERHNCQSHEANSSPTLLGYPEPFPPGCREFGTQLQIRVSIMSKVIYIHPRHSPLFLRGNQKRTHFLSIKETKKYMLLLQRRLKLLVWVLDFFPILLEVIGVPHCLVSV